MASCSIREELVAEYPTCIDYTTISSPIFRAMPIQPTWFIPKPKLITEDGEQQRMHVVHRTERQIGVYNYQGHNLFSYPNNNHHGLRPKGMCICNNLVYVTSPMLNELFLFTTEGDLITLYKDNIQEGVNTSLTLPSRVVSDENNNIYICTTDELVVMNSALPVFQKHKIDKARPKDIRLFREEIVILCWEQPGVSINILSLACVLLRRIFLREFKRSTKPLYFDIDHYGNFVIPSQFRDHLYVYSKDGKMLVKRSLKFVMKPMEIKLLENRRSIGQSNCSSFGLCLF